MILKQLFTEVSWEQIESFLPKWNGDEVKNIAGYKTVFGELRDKVPETLDHPHPFIIQIRQDEENGDELVGFDPVESQIYALDFIPWAQILSCEMDSQTLASYSKETIVLECIYEITFWGWTEKKVQTEANKLSRRIDSDEWIEVPEGMSSFDFWKHREANKNES